MGNAEMGCIRGRDMKVIEQLRSAHGPYRAPQRPIVYVVDGDSQARESLEKLIRSAGWQPRVAASAEEFLSYPRTAAPTCLVLELDLPGMSGLELQRRVLERRELSVIFMSRDTDVTSTVRAMKAGAFEFLTKPVAEDVLVTAIRHALECSEAALPEVARMHALEQRYGSLSPREREVMTLIVSGRLNKQVGGELGIAEVTVKAHRGSMMRKMQAGSLAELVIMAGNLGSNAAASAA
jgi:FixJ family two-component response regulator